MRSISVVWIFTFSFLNAANADCQMPDHPDSQTTAWYYNCVQAEATQQQYEIEQQAAELRAIQDRTRQQQLAR